MAGALDSSYEEAGARLLPSGPDVFQAAELIVKVKEILPSEYDLLEAGPILFTNIHAALNRPQLDRFLEVGPGCHFGGKYPSVRLPQLCSGGRGGGPGDGAPLFAPHSGTGRHFMGHFGESPLKAIVLGSGTWARGFARAPWPRG